MTDQEKQLRDKLKSIREVLDADVIDCDIISIQNKATKLTQMIGLSAECKAESKRLVERKKLKILIEEKDNGYQASVLTKLLDAGSANETALYIYADRINAGITHAIDMLRSSISLYKSELENSLKG
jgi:hypothetical protein